MAASSTTTAFPSGREIKDFLVTIQPIRSKYTLTLAKFISLVHVFKVKNAVKDHHLNVYFKVSTSPLLTMKGTLLHINYTLSNISFKKIIHVLQSTIEVKCLNKSTFYQLFSERCLQNVFFSHKQIIFFLNWGKEGEGVSLSVLFLS